MAKYETKINLNKGKQHIRSNNVKRTSNFSGFFDMIKNNFGLDVKYKKILSDK